MRTGISHYKWNYGKRFCNRSYAMLYRLENVLEKTGKARNRGAAGK